MMVTKKLTAMSFFNAIYIKEININESPNTYGFKYYLYSSNKCFTHDANMIRFI